MRSRESGEKDLFCLQLRANIMTARRRDCETACKYLHKELLHAGSQGESGNIISLLSNEAILEVGRRLGAVLFVSLCTNDPQVSITYYWLFTVR